MVFTKSFPKNNGAKIWKEVSLTEDEELAAEEYAFDENARAMAECIICAKNIVENMGLKDYQYPALPYNAIQRGSTQ